MTVIRPGRGVHIVANKELTHGLPHFQAGLVGIVQKQDEPKAFDSLASRTKVASGVKYFLLTKGETELAELSGATVGALVYIAEADDSLSLSSGAGKVAFGRVTGLGGTFGLPTGKMRVDMQMRA